MSDFAVAYERMIRNEGGYVLHQVAGDRGGQTYAGIARNFLTGGDKSGNDPVPAKGAFVCIDPLELR